MRAASSSPLEQLRNLDCSRPDKTPPTTKPFYRLAQFGCDKKCFPLVSSGGDFFGEELQEEFGKVERSDKINRKLERGFKNFEER